MRSVHVSAGVTHGGSGLEGYLNIKSCVWFVSRTERWPCDLNICCKLEVYTADMRGSV